MHQRGDDASARSAKRVPDGDRATVAVDDRRIEIGPLAKTGDRLRRKGLVQLHSVEVAPSEPGATKRESSGRDRPNPEQVGIDPRCCAAYDAGERGDANPFGAELGR